MPIPFFFLAKDYFHHQASAEIVKLIDQTAHRSGLDRGRVFDDFLQTTICSLSGGQMETEYLQTIQPYVEGKQGKRAIDLLPKVLGTLINAMEETRSDILGDVFEGAISRGLHGQFFTPEPVCMLMTRVTDEGNGRTVNDPCCGSGRLLLESAKINRNREFIGQDIDLRCVRITAINLALHNLYGWVIHGNSLTLDKKLIYRTGFNGRGFVKVVPPEVCPYPVSATSPEQPTQDESMLDEQPTPQKSVQQFLFE